MMLVILVMAAGAITIYFVVETIVLKQTIDDSHSRIMDKINSVIDGVKTFLTVTLIDRISSAFGPIHPDDREDDDIEI